MEYPTIQAESRSGRGKGAARRTRATGRIPAVAYGGGGDAVSLSVNPRDLLALHKQARGWNTPFELAVEGGEDLGLTMLKAVQKHPVSAELLHADFLRVQPGQMVEVRVPVRLSGKCPGVEQGGKLSQPVRDMTLRCLPGAIPASVDIDISLLEIGDKVMISDLPFGEGVAAVFHNDSAVVSVVSGRVAKVETEEAEDEAEAEPEAE